jgi:amphi-Trp domain-containing protein
MSDTISHESRRKRSRRAIASYLHRVADALDAGKPVALDPEGEDDLAVTPGPEPLFEIEVQDEDDGLRALEFELEWNPDDVEDSDAAEAEAASSDAAEATAASSDATFELYADKAGKYRWRLRHTNSNIIADSGEGYSSKANAKNGINSVRRNAPGADIEEQ